MRSMFLALLLFCAVLSHAAPVVFWASDPIRPGETTLVTGADLGPAPLIEVTRLADGSALSGRSSDIWKGSVHRVPALQSTPESVKFTLPRSLTPGIFAYRILMPAGSVSGLLNAPALWWAQGNLGEQASPGGWVRVFGKNLAHAVQPHTLVRLMGPKSLTLQAAGDGYAAQVALPKDLPAGTYHLTLHGGYGGRQGWSNSVSITICPPTPWPSTIFNVKDFGAGRQGLTDDTAAINAALTKAGEAGGGIVYLPRGRYHLTAGLNIPRFTVLRGAGRDLVALFWADTLTPPRALIQGTNSFGIEDLTCYSVNYDQGIYADQNEPGAGDVFLRRVRVQFDRFRGHPKDEDLARGAKFRYRGDSVHLGGRNVEITDCDIYGSGRSLSLGNVRGGRVAHCNFYNGQQGWYSLSGSDGLIFEHNQIMALDPTGTGGGINCLGGYTNSQNVYYANNTLKFMLGQDREAMTSDAGGGYYMGPVAKVDGVRTTLAGDPVDPKVRKNWVGGGFYIQHGRGQGQYRQIVAMDGREITLDRPWDVEPDATSTINISGLQKHYLILGNTFADTGVAIQFYGGPSMDCIIAGNHIERSEGINAIGKPYGGYHLPEKQNPCQQACWYLQFIDNTIAEGAYHLGEMVDDKGRLGYPLSMSAHIMIEGRPSLDNWPWPLIRSIVIRRNHLLNNAEIMIGQRNASVLPTTEAADTVFPFIRDIVVDGNDIANADNGIRVQLNTTGILLNGNVFSGVTTPYAGFGLRNAMVDGKAGGK